MPSFDCKPYFMMERSATCESTMMKLFFFSSEVERFYIRSWMLLHNYKISLLHLRIQIGNSVMDKQLQAATKKVHTVQMLCKQKKNNVQIR